MEILCVYIRTNAPWDMDFDVPWDTETPGPFKRPRADIQAALTVIGRRAPDKIALERTKRFELDLRFADLGGADLRDGDFAQARFWRSNFQSAGLMGTTLKVQTSGTPISQTPSLTKRVSMQTPIC